MKNRGFHFKRGGNQDEAHEGCAVIPDVFLQGALEMLSITLGKMGGVMDYEI